VAKMFSTFVPLALSSDISFTGTIRPCPDVCEGAMNPNLTSNSGQNSYILYFLKLTYSCRKVFQIFLNFWHDVKKLHLTSILTFFVRSSVAARFCRPPRFRPVLLCLQTTWARQKSRWAVVCSAVQRQSTFQSVPVPGSRRVWGEAGSQSGLSLLFLSVLPHGYGQKTETALLYTH
jgi:hypothetical protein